MNVFDFFDLEKQCIICKSDMIKQIKFSLDSIPICYTIKENNFLYRDNSDKETGIMISQLDILSIKNNKLHVSDEEIEWSFDYSYLISECKLCCKYSYHSMACTEKVLDFELSHERYASVGEYILIANTVHDKTYITISINPLKRFTLDYKPIKEWIVDGDARLVEDKIMKLKVLM